MFPSREASHSLVHNWVCTCIDLSFVKLLRTPVLCHNSNVSTGNMEAELRLPYPRVETLASLYEQVGEFVTEK